MGYGHDQGAFYQQMSGVKKARVMMMMHNVSLVEGSTLDVFSFFFFSIDRGSWRTGRIERPIPQIELGTKTKVQTSYHPTDPDRCSMSEDQ